MSSRAYAFCIRSSSDRGKSVAGLSTPSRVVSAFTVASSGKSEDSPCVGSAGVIGSGGEGVEEDDRERKEEDGERGRVGSNGNEGRLRWMTAEEGVADELRDTAGVDTIEMVTSNCEDDDIEGGSLRSLVGASGVTKDRGEFCFRRIDFRECVTVLWLCTVAAAFSRRISSSYSLRAIATGET
jgi:hypothetical protein